MANKKDIEVIDLMGIIKTLWQNKKLFYKVIPLAFLLSCLYIICIPRTFSTSTRLAPELEGTMGGGTLGSIASSFGIDLSDAQTTDAISPLLYPDLMEDNAFVAKLFDIEVESKDGEIKTNYYNYLKENQKRAWWSSLFLSLKKLLPKDADDSSSGIQKKSPYTFTRIENGIAEKIRNSIKLSVDKRTGVITIAVEAQDPLICKTVADSTRTALQNFITEYRTNKAKIDLDYYQKLTTEAKRDYEKARQLYGSFSDANTDVILESFRAKQNDLENDMQLKFNTYTALNTQLQQAKAKVQEKTPAFTLLKGAAVPIKASGPKRMIFVALMTILACFGTSGYILLKRGVKEEKTEKLEEQP